MLSFLFHGEGIYTLISPMVLKTDPTSPTLERESILIATVYTSPHDPFERKYIWDKILIAAKMLTLIAMIN